MNPRLLLLSVALAAAESQPFVLRRLVLAYGIAIPFIGALAACSSAWGSSLRNGRSTLRPCRRPFRLP